MARTLPETFHQTGTPEVPFGPVSDIWFDPKGPFFVTDEFNHQVQVFDSGYKLVRAFGGKGSGNGEFLYPKSVEGVGDRIYVADCWNHRIQWFDREGNYQGSFGRYGSGEGEFYEPYHILFHENRIFVVDRCNHRIQVFDPDHRPLGAVGHRGTSYEEKMADLFLTARNVFPVPSFEFPCHMEVGPDGHFHVSDCNNHRIVRLSPDLAPAGSIGKRGDGAGEMFFPGRVAFSEEGNLVVSDFGNKRILVFSRDNFPLGVMGPSDFGLDELHVSYLGIRNGNLYVGNSFQPEVGIYPLELSKKESKGPEPDRKIWRRLHRLSNAPLQTVSPGEFQNDLDTVTRTLWEEREKWIPFLLDRPGPDRIFLSAAERVPNLSGPDLQKALSSLTVAVRFLNALLGRLEEGLRESYRRKMETVVQMHKRGGEFRRLLRNQKSEIPEYDLEYYHLLKENLDQELHIKEQFIGYKKWLDRTIEILEALREMGNPADTASLFEETAALLWDRLGFLSSTVGEKNSFLNEARNHFEPAVSGDPVHMVDFRSQFERYLTGNLYCFYFLHVFVPALNRLTRLLEEVKSPDPARARPLTDGVMSVCLSAGNMKRSSDALFLLIDIWSFELNFHESLHRFFSLAEPGHLSRLDFHPDKLRGVESIEGFAALQADLSKMVLLTSARFGLEGAKSAIPVQKWGIDGEIHLLDVEAAFSQGISQIPGHLEKAGKQFLDISNRIDDRQKQMAKTSSRDVLSRMDTEDQLFLHQFQYHELGHVVSFYLLNEWLRLFTLHFQILVNAAYDFSNGGKEKARGPMDLFLGVLSHEEEMDRIIHPQVKKLILSLSGKVMEKPEEGEGLSSKIELTSVLEGLSHYPIYAYSKHLSSLDRIHPPLAEFFLQGFVDSGAEPSSLQQIVDRMVTEGRDRNWNMGRILENSRPELASLKIKRSSPIRFQVEGSFGSFGVEPDLFRGPGFIRADEEGFLWICDNHGYRVQKFRRDGRFVSSFGSQGFLEHQFNLNTHLAVLGENGLAFLNKNNRSLQFFTREGKFIRAVSFARSTGGSDLAAIDSYPENQILAVDFSKRVYLLDGTGSVIRSWTVTTGLWDVPRSVSGGEAGSYYVGMKGEIVRFDESGKVVSSATQVNAGNGDFGELSLISDLVWHKGFLFCADSLNGRLLVLDSGLRLVDAFGGFGTSPGKFLILSSIGIWEDRLFLTDLRNRRIQRVRISLPS